MILVSSSSALLLCQQLRSLSETFTKKTGAKGQIITRSLDETTTFADLRGLMGSSSLFAEKQLIILRHTLTDLKLPERTQLHAFIAAGKVADTTTLILAEGEPLPAAKKDKLADYVRSSKKVKKISVKPPTGRALEDHLQNLADDLKIKVEPAALRELVVRLGDDFDQLVLRVEQLALQAASSSKSAIDITDVEQVVKKPIQLEIFKTITALAERNRAEALKRLHDHLEEGEHPLYLLSMMRYQFRTLAALKSASQQSTDQREIASLTKLSPFVVRKGLQLVRNFEGRSLSAIFDKLVDADHAIKSGRVEGDAALDLITIAICN